MNMTYIAATYFAWGDLSAAGLACDIAGAIILALSFMVKTPAAIRSEVPLAVSGIEFGGGFSSIGFPQALAHSMSRQRAEALLGAPVLVSGFGLQAVTILTPSTHLGTTLQKLVALGLVLCIWALCFLLWKTFVPWLEDRTIARLQS